MAEVRLRGYDEVREGYRAKDLKQALYDEGGVVMRDVLLTLHGEEHRLRRRLENRLFRRPTFAWFEREVMPRVIADTLAPFIAAGSADLLVIGRRTTMNLTADIAGVDRPAQTDAETALLERFVRTFGEGATVVHSTRDKSAVNAEVAAALEEFDEVFLQPSVARREALIETQAELPNDVLTTLLVNDDQLHLPYEVIRREIAFYLQAGSHSTANATAHALADLWASGSVVDIERARHDLVFAQRCAHESLRLHPASPVAWRTALSPVSMKSGCAIAAGDTVIFELEAANRDPAVWGEHADRYDPHRRVPVGVLPWGHSFGGGAHACIGAELDGGTAWIEGTSRHDTHLFGTVALIMQAILQAGGRPDPNESPTLDSATARTNYARYPVVFA
jgi:cytochrome P450